MSRNWTEALADFLDDGGMPTSRPKRILASFFGASLFHFALFVVALNKQPNAPSDIFLWSFVVYVVIVSFLFALLISTGTKGGLIRRFWYGVILPAVSYYLAFEIHSKF